jgi:dTDP-4-dehydrorhamnose reductase
LVFGKTGQVATELQRSVDVLALGRDQADLSDPVACVQAIRALAPRAVINAAAYTAVDKAEEDEELATIINGDAPTAIAQACAEMQIPLVHISTDYVFEGLGKRLGNPAIPRHRRMRMAAVNWLAKRVFWAVGPPTPFYAPLGSSRHMAQIL